MNHAQEGVRPVNRWPCIGWRLVCTLLLSLAGGVAGAQTPITLQLKWHHAFQFAGYYAAVAQGYYREAGLDVTLREATPGADPLQTVLEGQAQYGVGTSSLLLARARGGPVVVLAVVFQHSPLVLLAREQPDTWGIPGTQGVHDVVGKRVMMEPQSDELVAYLKQVGIGLDRLTLQPHTFQVQDLIDGRVDVMSAYVTNETYFLERSRIPHQVHTPRSTGIDFYGDNLFTTESELRNHPDRVRAFRAASLRGWRYAMEHPREVAALIRERYSQAHPLDFFLFEAERMVPLLRTDLIEVGYMTRGRWQHIADTYADLGLLPRTTTLDGFLYEPDARADTKGLMVALTLLVVVSGVLVYIIHINRRLAQALTNQRRAEIQALHLAHFDPLTDLPNRRLLQDRVDRMLADLRRRGGHGALAFLDLDNFKSLNDTHGHALGDQLLVAVAQRLLNSVRESDTVARLGGDEFVLLIGALDANPTAARSQAEAVGATVLRALAQPHRLMPTNGGPPVSHTCTASIGVVVFDGQGTPEALRQRADAAMYRAKQQGRNQLVVEPG